MKNPQREALMGKNRRRSAVASGTGLVAAAAMLGATALGLTTSTAAVAAARPAHVTARPAAAASQAMTVSGPQIRLIAGTNQVEVPKFGKQDVYIDPGIWVASLRSAFQIDVSRAVYASHETATQVIRTADGTVNRPLPSWVLAGWNGIRHFIHLTIRNSRGRIIDRSELTFCPDIYELAKATPNSANTSSFPQQCGPGDPFGVGEVWGIARGWAVDALGYQGYRLYLGTYKLTETISPQYLKLFDIPLRAGTATVTVKVVSSKQCGQGCFFGKRAALPAHFVRVAVRPAGAAARSRLPSLPAARILTQAPADAEPDLIPLPSWGISVSNTKKGQSYLAFGATVWIGGNSPLDVEGYRIAGSNTMRAYQYFYKDGKIIGRMRVGTMGFAEYNAWHFQQFAKYALLKKDKKVAVRSHKVGFCIAPTDGVDMLLPHSAWQPSYTGLEGNCGNPSALFVQELLPIGWGDTYFQTVPYQSFDITKIPNGTYYIEIIANPEHLLHETNTANDISLREVIIGGKRGHRTVRVPAWHGIDPENGNGGVGGGPIPLAAS
jgi:Lysyl oxidase